MNLLFEAAARATIVLGLALLATTLLRHASADIRGRIWRAALTATALLFLPIPTPEPFRISSTVLANAADTSSNVVSAIPFLVVIWTTGLAVLLARLGVRVAALIGITRSAATLPDDGVRVTSAIATPMTWGALRPVILLPDYVLDLPLATRTAILRHERAHIERHDWLWQIFAECLTAVLWFHPLVWLAAARLRSEAEHAADDFVLADGTTASSYARQLLEIARRVKQPPLHAAVAMIRRPRDLESRIAAIVDSSRARAQASRQARLTVLLTAASLLLFLAACQSARLYKVAQVQTPPKVVTKVEPNYTDDARNAKVEGQVVLSLEVTPQGQGKNIRVTKSLDKGLDRQAIAAIEKWSFAPGLKDGKPVRVAATIEVNFRLR